MPEWTALAEHRERQGEVSLRQLFAGEPGRGERYSLQVGDLYLDYSKHLVTDETLALLRDLAAAHPASPDLLTDWGNAPLGAPDVRRATLAYRRALHECENPAERAHLARRLSEATARPFA